MTLTFDLLTWKFQMALIPINENNCVKLYINPSIIVGVMIRIIIWPSSVTLILGLPEQMFQMPHLSVMENICVISFLKIHPQLCKSWAEQIRQTQERTHIQQTIIVTTMSGSPQAGSTKKNFRLLQTERASRWELYIWWKWQKVLKRVNNCGKRRNFLL